MAKKYTYPTKTITIRKTTHDKLLAIKKKSIDGQGAFVSLSDVIDGLIETAGDIVDDETGIRYAYMGTEWLSYCLDTGKVERHVDPAIAIPAYNKQIRESGSDSGYYANDNKDWLGYNLKTGEFVRQSNPPVKTTE